MQPGVGNSSYDSTPDNDFTKRKPNLKVLIAFVIYSQKLEVRSLWVLFLMLSLISSYLLGKYSPTWVFVDVCWLFSFERQFWKNPIPRCVDHSKITFLNSTRIFLQAIYFKLSVILFHERCWSDHVSYVGLHVEGLYEA